MPNIRPISDLRAYSEVLNTVSEGKPLFLTKNGRGRFAVLDMADYKKMTATLELMSKLSMGEESAKNEGWHSLEEALALVAKA